MGPEEGSWKVEPGRIWLVPVDADGQPMEGLELGERVTTWNIDRGDDWGLDGGLQGGPNGALMETGRGISASWTLELTGEIPEETMALLFGYSLEQYRDLVKWSEECAWLERVTGLNWGRFE